MSKPEKKSPIKAYHPAPADTSQITLPASLLSLQEEIARNVHEVWAQGRMKEGWTYGPIKDEQKRETPMLTAYENLPESEKDYDRRTAMETLKLIVSLGYTIQKEEQKK